MGRCRGSPCTQLEAVNCGHQKTGVWLPGSIPAESLQRGNVATTHLHLQSSSHLSKPIAVLHACLSVLCFLPGGTFPFSRGFKSKPQAFLFRLDPHNLVIPVKPSYIAQISAPVPFTQNYSLDTQPSSGGKSQLLHHP